MCTTFPRTSTAPPECARCPPMCCSPGISYCIFDLESAIFDTRHVYRKALNDLAFSYYTQIPAELLLQSKPMTTAEMAELICRKCDIPVSAEEFRSELNERAAELIANPPMMGGAEHLVTHLRKFCIELGLVTSCSEANYCAKIRGREEFFGNFSTVVCADDWELRAQKPEPDVYLIAMSRLGDAGPGCTLVFDGTPKGVQAARDARLPVVMPAERELPCCWSELASLRLNYLDEFNPEEFNLPQYPDEAPPWQRRPSRRRYTRRSTFTALVRRRRTVLPTTEFGAFSPPEEEEKEEEEEEPPPPRVVVQPSVLNIRD